MDCKLAVEEGGKMRQAIANAKDEEEEEEKA